MSRVRVGMVGVGRWGRLLARSIARYADVCAYTNAGNKKRVVAFASEHPNAINYANLQTLLDDTSLDAIVVATPISTHYTIGQTCLKAGKHLFIEKPLACSSSEVHDLIDIARINNRVLFSGYTFLYHPACSFLAEICRKERPSFLSFTWNKFGTFNESSITNLLPHDVAIATELVGSLSGWRTVRYRNYIGKADIFKAEASFLGGKVDFSINRLSLQQPNKVVIVETNRGRYRWVANRIERLLDNQSEVIFIDNDTRPLEAEIADFFSHIKTNAFWTRAGGSHDAAVACMITSLL